MLTEGWRLSVILTRTLGILVLLGHFRRYVLVDVYERMKNVILGADVLLGS